REVLLTAMPDNITLLSAVKLQQCHVTEDSVQFTDDQGQVYQAQLAIAADGANSWLRQQAGISVTQYPYQQRAIVATIKTELPHQNTAYQCFLATGPVALLPLDNAHHCSLVWSADTEYAEQLLAQSDAEFNRALSAVVESHLGKVQCVSQRLSFPLQMRHADTYVQPRIALIGDAIRTIHPLAGQGVNLGLQDAHALAHIITKAVAAKRDFASEQQLKKYQRARKSASLAMIVAMEFFKQAFARQDEKLKSLRHKTISTIEKRQWLKRLFAAVAQGDTVTL
ncbi:MAG: FAD-dependent monooxygenase, partial [Gammaproteobacteria bacterium]|nr:FAD-dependent monooxygenase [Gammaproteobacteria bacterium]